MNYKQAREAMPNPFSDDSQKVFEFKAQALEWLGKYYFEILKSLSAFERMQCVDFEELDGALEEGIFCFENAMDFPTHLQREAMLKAARTLADMKKELE